MANTNTITFRIGEETRPVLETENLEKSIFSELYQKAFAEINNYIGKVSNIDNDEKGGYNYEGVNNIFAFIGERGAGKTSCMMSVAKALEKKDKNLSIIEGLENIKQTTFLNSVLIDPSFFDQKNNILSLIIAHLFQSFRDQASKKDCKNDEEKRRTLIACFEKVQKNLNNLFPKDNSLSTDTLEGLVNFSAAIDLQKNIKALIDAYLSFMNDGKAEFLVLMIDDIDLHTNHAREMVEQIRKYFIQPNVVVLMAVKIDQLSHVIKNGLSEEYKTLIKNKEMSFDLINEMVERYLGKLLPHSHRIYLPDASVYFHSKLKITFNKKDAKEIEYTSVREGVLSLIFEKTRYLFYNTIDTTSYIIPRNLRELRQIIALLAEMDTFRDSEKESEPDKNRSWLKAREYNQTLFLKYFKETWCVNNLTEKSASYITELFKIVDPLLINKTTLKFLQSYFEDLIGDESNKKIGKEEFYRILKPQNKTYNISLGDVMFVLNELLSILNIEKDRNFIYAIKAFYSVKLYSYYNQLADSSNLKDRDEEIVVKEDSLSQFSNLEKLIAGSYIETRNNDIIDASRIKVLKDFLKQEIEIEVDLILEFCKSIDDENIEDISNLWNSTYLSRQNSKLIKDEKLLKYNCLYAACIFSFRNIRAKGGVLSILKRVSDSFVINNSELFEKVQQDITLNINDKHKSRSITLIRFDKFIRSIDKETAIIAELILTLISRRPNTDNEKNYREKDEVRFDSDVAASGQKNVYFDIYAPFYNLLDLRRCYNQVTISNFNLFHESLRDSKSLIGRLFSKLKNERSECIQFVKDFETLRDNYQLLSKKNAKFNDIYTSVEYIFNKHINSDIFPILTQPKGKIELLKIEIDKLLEVLYDSILPYLRSWVVIRNVEILDALLVEIYNSKNNLRANKGDELTVYKNFFDLVSKFSMNTYKGSAGLNDNKDEVNLSFMAVYSDIISEEINKRKVDNMYRSLFEEIFATHVTEKVYNALYY